MREAKLGRVLEYPERRAVVWGETASAAEPPNWCSENNVVQRFNIRTLARPRSAVLAAWVTLSISWVSHAVAECSAGDLSQEGRWVNVNPNTGSLAQIVITFVCHDMLFGPDDEAWAGMMIHPFGACENGECDWGRSRAESLQGRLLYVSYRDSHATRYLFAQISPYGADELV